MENYTVKLGDTLDYIAQLYNVSVNDLINANKLVPPYYLTQGQILVIPTSNYDIFEYYKVNKNDTLYSIAKKYNTDPNMLAAINGININEYIYPNQMLLVPKNNVRLYITKSGDTLKGVADNLGITEQRVVSNNNTIYLLPDQLIIARE